MTPDQARRTLGVPAGASIAEVLEARRRLLVQHHPDRGGDPRRAAAVNQAVEVLRRHIADPHRPPAPDPDPPVRRPPPTPAPSAVVADAPDADRALHLDVEPAAVFATLVEAGHRIGEVGHVDHDAGIIEVIVGDPPGVGQLAVTVGHPSGDGVPVAFSLETLGVAPAPPIDRVVAALLGAARTPRR